MALSRFTAIIPARLGSTRLPRKVLADIHGKPMVVRVAERAALAGFARVVVATDAEEVVAACRHFNINALLTPAAQTGTDRVVMAVAALGLGDDECVINVQGDEPLIHPQWLAATAHALIASRHPCATPIGRIQQVAAIMNPNIVKCVVNHQFEALLFSRAPIPWRRGAFPHATTLPDDYRAYRHYGVYAFRVPFVKSFPTLPKSDLETSESLEQLRILQAGHGIQTVCVDGESAPAVDTEEDLALVRTLFHAGVATPALFG